MGVTRDGSGRRTIRVEVEVPGSPEVVWRAIATGPGVSAWFFPSEIGEQVGGDIVCRMGPGMEARATVTSWDPPHRFTAEADDLGPAAPRLETEWTIEAKAGGSCVVRVVHGLATDRDEWDGFLESFTVGWPRFFRVLSLYLTRFPDLPGSSLRATGSSPSSESEAWHTLSVALGLDGVAAGERFEVADEGVPPMAGIVEAIGSTPEEGALLLLDRPGPGIATAGVSCAGEGVWESLAIFQYGENASAVIDRDGPRWQRWIEGMLP